MPPIGTFNAIPYVWKTDGVISILNPLAGKVSEDTRKKGKGAKTGASHDWRSFHLSQYDWLKGSHMTKVVWLPNETDYSYSEFVAPILPIGLFYLRRLYTWLKKKKTRHYSNLTTNVYIILDIEKNKLLVWKLPPLMTRVPYWSVTFPGPELPFLWRQLVE